MSNQAERSVHLAGESISLRTQPGFEGWAGVDPTTELIAEYARVGAGDHVLIWPGGNGALAVLAARRAGGTCTAIDTHLLAAKATEATARANGVETTVSCLLPTTTKQAYDAILMRAPKGRQAARMYLALAAQALSPQGRLYLAGANKTGIKSVLKDASELFGSSTLLGYRRGCRVARLTEPLADTEPHWLVDGVRPGSCLRQTMAVGDSKIEVCSKPGVFSWQHLDVGTELLIQHADLADAERILDVGCGCGVIGAWAALTRPQAKVTLCDVDAIAVDCAQQTLATNGLDNASVVHANGLESAPIDCDLILSNPPFHAGHGIAYDMVNELIAQAPRHLAPGGRLVLVANRFLPYDRLMEKHFGNVTAAARTAKFHVLQSTKRKDTRRPKARRPRRPR